MSVLIPNSSIEFSLFIGTALMRSSPPANGLGSFEISSVPIHSYSSLLNGTMY